MKNAKLLLFGEHSVLYGSDCLALPYARYGGVLTMEDPEEPNEVQLARWSNRQLYAFYGHILQSLRDKSLPCNFDLERMATELAHGLWFKGNIPGSAGFGSSGALVAAVSDRYFSEDFCKLPTSQQLSLLAGLENNFHGNSSGVDPLVAYLNRPVAIVDNDPILPDISSNIDPSVSLFLVQAKQEQNTMAMITRFKERMNDDAFKDNFVKRYVPAVNAMVYSVLHEPKLTWFDKLEGFTELHAGIFKPLISDILLKATYEGVNKQLYYLKLLGSGGGYMLGFTKNYKASSDILKSLGIEPQRLKHSHFSL